MLVDTETRLGMQLATFVPAEDASGYRFPSVSDSVTPTVQAFVGGNTARNIRAASDNHPGRGVVLVEAPVKRQHFRRLQYDRHGNFPLPDLAEPAITQHHGRKRDPYEAGLSAQ